MIRNATTFCKHFRLFAFNWIAMLNYIFDIHATIVSNSYVCRDDDSDFLRSIQWKQFTMISSWLFEMKTKISCWKIFDNFVNIFCNDDQQLQILCFFIELRRTSSHYIEQNYSFFQKFVSLFDLKQRVLNDFDKKIK